MLPAACTSLTLTRSWLVLTLIGLLVVPGGSQAQAGSAPAPVPSSFRAAVVGADIVVEGSGKLRVVELPKDGLLYGPGGDINFREPNPGAPSTPRAVLFGSEVEPGSGCRVVPQVRGVEGFSALCPLQSGSGVRVSLGAGDDRLRADGGTQQRYYSDVFQWLRAPLDVDGGGGDDRIDTQTLGPVLVDGGPGDDRISLGLSGPHNKLRGGPGDDTFAYKVFAPISGSEYDLTPPARTRRVELECGPGADFVAPHRRFRHGGGCPAQPPPLKAEPLSVRATCRERCRWRGPQELIVTILNPTSRAVTLRSARLAIERWDADYHDHRFVMLARRKRLRLQAQGTVRIAIPARRRRALNSQLEGYILFFGFAPSLGLTGALIERDGDRTRALVDVRVRRGPIAGVDW